MKNYSKYGKGWYNESQRHRLARLGIRTGRKSASLGFGIGKRFTNYAKYNAGDTIAGQIMPGNKVRADITGDIIKLDKEEMKGLSVGDRVTLTFGGTDRVSEVEKEERINYYKISSISNKDKVELIRGKIANMLRDKGYSANVTIKDNSIYLSDVRISDDRVKEQGHNLQYSPYTKSGVRKTRSLAWDDWVEVNDAVNNILDINSISANVKSLGGKFDIRDKIEGRRSEQDWSDLAYENVGSMMKPVERKDYITKPEKKEGTQFGVLGKEGKVEKHMTIDISKIKSDDPLAYAYGFFQAKSGQPMSKDKGLAPEYIRGYKDAKAGKKINYALAKKVYSFDLGREIDRTTQPHLLGNFDVDFRDPKASNPEARKWTYGGSRKTVTGALSDVDKLKALSSTMEIRIVEGNTGKIIKKINYAYTPGDLPGIVTTGLGTAGAEAVGWIPALVAVGATKKIVKDIKKMTKKKKKRGR